MSKLKENKNVYGRRTPSKKAVKHDRNKCKALISTIREARRVGELSRWFTFQELADNSRFSGFLACREDLSRYIKDAIESERLVGATIGKSYRLTRSVLFAANENLLKDENLQSKFVKWVSSWSNGHGCAFDVTIEIIEDTFGIVEDNLCVGESLDETEDSQCELALEWLLSEGILVGETYDGVETYRVPKKELVEHLLMLVQEPDSKKEEAEEPEKAPVNPPKPPSFYLLARRFDEPPKDGLFNTEACKDWSWVRRMKELYESTRGHAFTVNVHPTRGGFSAKREMQEFLGEISRYKYLVERPVNGIGPEMYVYIWTSAARHKLRHYQVPQVFGEVLYGELYEATPKERLRRAFARTKGAEISATPSPTMFGLKKSKEVEGLLKFAVQSGYLSPFARERDGQILAHNWTEKAEKDFAISNVLGEPADPEEVTAADAMLKVCGYSGDGVNDSADDDCDPDNEDDFDDEPNEYEAAIQDILGESFEELPEGDDDEVMTTEEVPVLPDNNTWSFDHLPPLDPSWCPIIGVTNKIRLQVLYKRTAGHLELPFSSAVSHAMRGGFGHAPSFASMISKWCREGYFEHLDKGVYQWTQKGHDEFGVKSESKVVPGPELVPEPEVEVATHSVDMSKLDRTQKDIAERMSNLHESIRQATETMISERVAWEKREADLKKVVFLHSQEIMLLELEAEKLRKQKEEEEKERQRQKAEALKKIAEAMRLAGLSIDDLKSYTS